MGLLRNLELEFSFAYFPLAWAFCILEYLDARLLLYAMILPYFLTCQSWVKKEREKKKKNTTRFDSLFFTFISLPLNARILLSKKTKKGNFAKRN